jgi:hypothetical protein
MESGNQLTSAQIAITMMDRPSDTIVNDFVRQIATRAIIMGDIVRAFDFSDEDRFPLLAAHDNVRKYLMGDAIHDDLVFSWIILEILTQIFPLSSD